VCLDARTGKRIWHFQLVHHDIWDWDIAAPPIQVDITVNSKRIKAVAQVTKQAFTYVFDRVTGQPVRPIEERPVPQSDVPGEKTSPTQPFPTRPAPFDRQGTSLDDLIDFTPELRAEAVKIASQYKLGPLYTPPIVAGTNGKAATLLLPSHVGGANWHGGAVDVETGVLYVSSVTNQDPLAMATGVPMTYMAGGRHFIVVAVGAAGFPAELAALPGRKTAGVTVVRSTCGPDCTRTRRRVGRPAQRTCRYAGTTTRCRGWNRFRDRSRPGCTIPSTAGWRSGSC